MKISTITTIASTLLFILISSFVFAKEVAIIKKLDGDVKVQRDGTNRTLKIGDKIIQSDTIITGSDGSVGLLFHDGTALSLGKESTISVEKYVVKPAERKYDFKLNMKKGLASFESGKIGSLAPESVEFRVPDGIIGIRGTKFFVEVKE